jgi:hypothetical protein
MYAQDYYDYPDVDLFMRIIPQPDPKEQTINFEFEQQNSFSNFTNNNDINENRYQQINYFHNEPMSYMDISERNGLYQYTSVNRTRESSNISKNYETNTCQLKNYGTHNKTNFINHYGNNGNQIAHYGDNLNENKIELNKVEYFDKKEDDFSSHNYQNIDNVDNENIIDNSTECEKEFFNCKKKLIRMKLAKKKAEKKYRMRMNEQYKMLANAVFEKEVNWKRREIIDLAIKYIFKLKNMNEILIEENIELKSKLANESKKT